MGANSNVDAGGAMRRRTAWRDVTGTVIRCDAVADAAPEGSPHCAKGVRS
jgi:hypothetical protein